MNAPAKRGDVVLITTSTHNYYINPTRVEEITKHEFGTVTNITRDGIVKRWTRAEENNPYPVPHGAIVRVVDKHTIDASALLAAFAARVWPSGKGSHCPFDTLDAARDFARQFLVMDEVTQ